jgi:hypothetical protein
VVPVADRQPFRPTLPEVRSAFRRRLGRVRSSWFGIAQTALAAAIAWALASLVNDNPFFAPISAVIALGLARGRRTLRAVELTLGVAVGIAVGDVIVLALGTGTLVVFLVVALAMAAALLLGAGTILVNQAAISATLTPPQDGISPSRFLDALIGGAVALLVGQVLFPRDPLRAMAATAAPVTEDLARALDATAEALRRGDEALADRALEIARAVDDDLAAFFDAVTTARETVPVLPGRRPRERLPLYAEAALRMDYAVNNTRVLIRRAAATIRRHGAAPPALADAVALLAEAVRALGTQLTEPGGEMAVRRAALRAAAKATSLLREDPDLSSVVIVGQIRSTAIDLLRGSGLGAEEARQAMEAVTEHDEAATDVALRTVPRPGARADDDEEEEER